MTAAQPVTERLGFASHPATRSARSLATICIVIGLAFAPTIVLPAPAFAQSSTYAHPYAPHVGDASLRFGIPESWIWAVMRQESGGNPKARSRVGAQGLMQIMPGTWAMLTARYSLGSNAYDVRANIMAGAAYLRMMWDRYRDVGLMLAAYNAGPGRVDAYANKQRGLPSETIDYVARIAPSLRTSAVASFSLARSSDVQSWRNASVFIAQPDGDSGAMDASPTAPGASMPASTKAAEVVPQEGRPHPLFFDMATSRK